LDGLVSGICAIGSVIIFAVSLQWDSALSATSVLALIFAGACAGFLVFNSHPAKIFLGEGGSTFCGLMLGILAIISGSKIATALLIMGIPILDIIWVVARRLIQGKSVASADLKHLHYRLMDVGLSHRQTVIFLYLITTLFGAISIFSTSLGKVIALLVLLLVMVILGFSLVYIYNNKKHVRSH